MGVCVVNIKSLRLKELQLVKQVLKMSKDLSKSEIINFVDIAIIKKSKQLVTDHDKLQGITSNKLEISIDAPVELLICEHLKTKIVLMDKLKIRACKCGFSEVI